MRNGVPRASGRIALIPALLLRVLSRSAVAGVLACGLAPTALAAQNIVRADSASLTAVGMSSLPPVRLPWALPPAFQPFGRMVWHGRPSAEIAAAEGTALRARLIANELAAWRTTVRRSRDALAQVPAGVAAPGPFEAVARPPADTGLGAILNTLLGDRSDVGITGLGRFESKLDRTKNERCTASQQFTLTSQCEAGFQPQFDFQFNTRVGGTFADRIHVLVDYDTQREFEASNNIHIFYAGKSDEMVDTAEIGNVSLQLPPSQFITSGIPQGNYGAQVTGQLGFLRYKTILARQTGNIPKTFQATVGDQTVKPNNADLEDYQIEARRFFFTVDPQLFGTSYPNIDILNATQMRSLAEALPETARPRRLSVYRLLIGGQPTNPNGPRFQIIGDPNSRPGQVYELLRENVDYYTDPSLLWVALARQVNLQNERLVIAYTLRVGGRDTVIADLGGTPDVSYATDHPQLAHLLWDPQVRPGDAAFRQEIRSVYRVAGQDLQRQSVTLRIVTGGGAGQEKPLAGASDTYLQMFGLSQTGNPALFDFDNRLWPRPGDPNVAIGVGGATNAKIIPDYFLVMPSVRPFARNGLVQPGNPVSDTIYTTPNEDLYSPQHPQSNYRLQLHYSIAGGSNSGMVALGAVQLRRFSELVQVDNTQLVRDRDYTIDYELGVVTFTRPDTLFPRPRQVSVRYEENPLFAAAPTTIFGLAGEIPFDRGQLGLTYISQSQTTSFTRPPLGFEPQSATIAGLNGHFGWEAAPLSRLL